MSTDNPALETENPFYTKPEESNLTETTDDSVTPPEVQALDQEDVSLDKPDEGKTEPEELAATEEDEETQYIELDGKEITLDELREYRDSGLRQSDYTKKTTEHAQSSKKERDELALERETLTKEREELSGMRDELTVLALEDDAINWTELKDEDPEEYIRLKEQADSRKTLLEKVKLERETPKDDPAYVETERKLFWESHPEWVGEDNKTTEAFKEDTTLMDAYVVKAGFSADEFGKMTSSKQLTTLLKAAKYDALQEKGREIKQKRDKVPVVTKPKVNTTQSKTMADTFYG